MILSIYIGVSPCVCCPACQGTLLSRWGRSGRQQVAYTPRWGQTLRRQCHTLSVKKGRVHKKAQRFVSVWVLPFPRCGTTIIILMSSWSPGSEHILPSWPTPTSGLQSRGRAGLTSRSLMIHQTIIFISGFSSNYPSTYEDDTSNWAPWEQLWPRDEQTSPKNPENCQWIFCSCSSWSCQPFSSHQRTGRRTETNKTSTPPCNTTWNTMIDNKAQDIIQLPVSTLPNMPVDVVVWIVPPARGLRRRMANDTNGENNIHLKIMIVEREPEWNNDEYHKIRSVTMAIDNDLITSTEWCPTPMPCPTSVRCPQCGWTCKRSNWELWGRWIPSFQAVSMK